MFECIFQPIHLILIFAIFLLLFGPSRLAGLGKGLGEAISGFKAALKEEYKQPKPPSDKQRNS
jgi:sec-independent protein translocase protein TatA